MKGQFSTGGRILESSIFPTKFRDYTEVNDHEVTTGTSLVNILKLTYPEARIDIVSLPQLNSGRRYADEIDYSPVPTDAFIASSNFVQKFKKELLVNFNYKSEIAFAEGSVYKRKLDPKRGVDTIDKSVAAFKESVDRKQKDKRTMECAYISSEMEVASKYTINRCILPGWAYLDYSGNNQPLDEYGKRAVALYKKMCKMLAKTAFFRNKLKHLLRDFALPLLKAFGSPLFSSDVVNKRGEHVNLQIFRVVFEHIGECMKLPPAECIKALKAYFSTLKDENGQLYPTVLRENMFIIYYALRIAAGYSYTSQFVKTSGGFEFLRDALGVNKERPVSILGKCYNHLIVTVSMLGQALKECTMLHDQKPARRRILLRNLKHADVPGGVYMMEGDFSRYDTNIPIQRCFAVLDVWGEIGEELKLEGFIHGDSNIQSEVNLIKWQFSSQPIVMPAGSSDSPSSAILVGGDVIWKGLASGTLCTNALGSGTTETIIIEAKLRLGDSDDTILAEYQKWWKEDVTDIMYLPSHLISSDDLSTLTMDPNYAKKLADAFYQVSSSAKLTSEVYLGGRFLMKHIFMGLDLPVAARVIQNTLSPEKPVNNGLKFELGILSRTEGFAGIRAFDVYGVGNELKLPKVVKEDHIATLEILLSFSKDAEIKSPDVIRYLEMMLTYLKGAGRVSAMDIIKHKVSRLTLISRLLAEDELTEIYDDRFSSSSASLLLILEKLGISVADVKKKEQQEYVRDLDALKIPRIF